MNFYYDLRDILKSNTPECIADHINWLRNHHGYSIKKMKNAPCLKEYFK